MFSDVRVSRFWKELCEFAPDVSMIADNNAVNFDVVNGTMSFDVLGMNECELDEFMDGFDEFMDGFNSLTSSLDITDITLSRGYLVFHTNFLAVA